MIKRVRGCDGGSYAETLLRLEDFVGAPAHDGAVSLSVQNEQQAEQIALLKSAHRDWVKDVGGRLRSLVEEFSDFVSTVQEEFQGYGH